MLLAAVTKTVKVVTNITNVVVSFKDYSIYPLGEIYPLNMSYVTSVGCYAIIRKTASKEALQCLNESASNRSFSQTVSDISGVSLRMSSSHWEELSASPTRENVVTISNQPSSTSKTKTISLVGAHLRLLQTLNCILLLCSA